MIMLLALALATAGPDRSPFAANCVGSDYADTEECQRFLRRAARIERRLVRIGFSPFEAWYDSIYFTPAERRLAIETFRICGPNGAVSRDENGPVCSDGDRS